MSQKVSDIVPKVESVERPKVEFKESDKSLEKEGSNLSKICSTEGKESSVVSKICSNGTKGKCL